MCLLQQTMKLGIAYEGMNWDQVFPFKLMYSEYSVIVFVSFSVYINKFGYNQEHISEEKGHMLLILIFSPHL
jgi:hypothetical protein